ncbi:MAG: class I SAM-dependent methyltransferase [Acidobacteria bacterium]|nr:class I SAM-dependent methyltransferase [Acidobacteriota bacterium]
MPRKTMARQSDSYTNLADIYDLLTKDSDIQGFYRAWRDSLLKAVRRYGLEVHTLVDLACGTGNTAIPWTERGWTVVGVDRSTAMLRVARSRSRRVRWICQDITQLHLKQQADLVTCHFDALNHVLAPEKLQRVFINVARILKKGGLFQFDLNTDHWLKWLAAHEKLFPKGQHFMVAHNEYDRKSGIATFHQLWFLRKGSLYAKREVSVQERAYNAAAIRDMVQSAGMRLVEATVQKRLEGRPIRMLYVARKPGA